MCRATFLIYLFRHNVYLLHVPSSICSDGSCLRRTRRLCPKTGCLCGCRKMQQLPQLPRYQRKNHIKRHSERTQPLETAVHPGTPPSAQRLPQTSPATCTTSLLDSSENLPQTDKTGFPTSGWQQFWILLKRTIFIILRDKMLTRMRLVSHFIIGILLGLIYYDIGNNAAKVMSNAGCLFFTVMFTMFTAMMPTILTCK